MHGAAVARWGFVGVAGLVALRLKKASGASLERVIESVLAHQPRASWVHSRTGCRLLDLGGTRYGLWGGHRSAAASPLWQPSGEGSLFGPGGQPYEQAGGLPDGRVAAHGHLAASKGPMGCEQGALY
eukprot:scaffold104638_cov69-Phaeocystis_antarctica.AAC.3